MSSGDWEIIIRRGTKDDIPGVLSCLAAAFGPYKTRYTSDGFKDTVPSLRNGLRRLRNMTVIVAEVDSARIIGTVAYHVAGAGEGHLRGMAVIPEFQGRGVACRLLSAAEETLRQEGCSRITLDTTIPLQRAIRFYVSNGYRATGIVKDYFGMPLYEYAKMWDNETG